MNENDYIRARDYNLIYAKNQHDVDTERIKKKFPKYVPEPMKIHATTELEMDYEKIIYTGGKNVGILERWITFRCMPWKQGFHEFSKTSFTMTSIDPKLAHSLEESRTRKKNVP